MLAASIKMTDKVLL